MGGAHTFEGGQGEPQGRIQGTATPEAVMLLLSAQERRILDLTKAVSSLTKSVTRLEARVDAIARTVSRLEQSLDRKEEDLVQNLRAELGLKNKILWQMAVSTLSGLLGALATLFAVREKILGG